MSRPSNTAERRAQIVDALMQVMAKRGYTGASIASIAAEAGLTPGLVHYHFDSKQSILLALLSRLRRGIRARYDERLERAGDDPWRRLFAFTDAFLEHDPTGRTGPLQATWLAISAEAVHQPAVREAFADMLRAQVERIDELLCAVLEREGRSRRGSRSLAAAIAAGIQGVYPIDAALPGLSKRGSSAPALRHMIEGLVAAQPMRAGGRGRARRR